MCSLYNQPEPAPRFSYVYRLTCDHPEAIERYYYGCRTSKVQPNADIYWSSSSVVRAAIATWGLSFFRKKILAVYATPDQALAKEVRLHTFFDVKNHPLFFNRANQTTLKFTTSGSLLEPRVKEKMSKAHHGQQHSAETRQKISRALRNNKNALGNQTRRGTKHSEYTKTKMSKVKLGNTLRLGTSHSDLTKEKLSTLLVGNKRAFGYKHSVQSKLKMSEAQKQRWLRKKHAIQPPEIEGDCI